MPLAEQDSHLLSVYSPLNIQPRCGRGLRLEAQDGRKYLDFYAGHAVAALGYGDEGLARVLESAARDLVFVSNLFPFELRERVALRLATAAPLQDPRVFFVNSGAEAVENALRISFRHHSRPALAVLEAGFHGRSAAASAATPGSASWYGFPNLPFEVRVLPWNDPNALADVLDDNVAALMVEPIQGIAGGRALSPDWINAARGLCDRHGILVVADEVQCGSGRSGQYFASTGIGLRPDIITLAKGVAAGFPAGAVLVSSTLAAELKTGDLGTTFGGGPLALAAMNYTLDRVLEPEFLAVVRSRSESLGQVLGCGPVRSIQGRGLLRGLRLSRLGRDVAAELRERGILVGTSSDPEVLRLTPPLVVDEEAIAQLTRTLEEITP